MEKYFTISNGKVPLIIIIALGLVSKSLPTVLPSYRPTVLPSYRPTVLPSYRPTVLPSYRPVLPSRPTVLRVHSKRLLRKYHMLQYAERLQLLNTFNRNLQPTTVRS
jgi:hypothetical protein